MEALMWLTVLGLVAFVLVVVTRKEFTFLGFIRDILGEGLVWWMDLLGWVGLFGYFGYTVYLNWPK